MTQNTDDRAGAATVSGIPQDTLDAVLAAVRAEPGRTAMAVGYAVTPPMGRGRALVALAELESQGRVRRETGQRNVSWYPAEPAGDEQH